MKPKWKVCVCHYYSNVPWSKCCASLLVSFLPEVKEDSQSLSSSPALEYYGTVWVFAPLSGLLLLHPDGTICSINDHLALSLFGYNKGELLKKVNQDQQLNKAVWTDNRGGSYFSCCCLINRVLLFWCPGSMDGCLTRPKRTAPSLILKLRRELHPKCQENMVSIYTPVFLTVHIM